jgi:hypothetical protein
MESLKSQEFTALVLSKPNVLLVSSNLPKKQRFFSRISALAYKIIKNNQKSSVRESK